MGTLAAPRWARLSRDVVHVDRGVSFAATGAHADLYLVDVRLPDGKRDRRPSLRRAGDPTPVVMISGHGIRDAVDATQSGVRLSEAARPRSRAAVVRHALEQTTLQLENQRFREMVGDGPRMIGRSDASGVSSIRRPGGQTDAGVLLMGNPARAKSCWPRISIAKARLRPARSSRSTAPRFRRS